MEKGRYFIGVMFFGIIFAGIIFFFNRELLLPQNDTLPETVRLRLEFPISKITVRVKKKELKNALKKCEWLDYSSTLISSKITITPRQGHEAEYKAIVNENYQAEKISNIYSSEGFCWNEISGEFVLPGNSSGILIPTWILFKLVEENKL